MILGRWDHVVTTEAALKGVDVVPSGTRSGGRSIQGGVEGGGRSIQVVLQGGGAMKGSFFREERGSTLFAIRETSYQKS